jgi:hypothetical protein
MDNADIYLIEAAGLNIILGAISAHNGWKHAESRLEDRFEEHVMQVSDHYYNNFRTANNATHFVAYGAYAAINLMPFYNNNIGVNGWQIAGAGVAITLENMLLYEAGNTAKRLICNIRRPNRELETRIKHNLNDAFRIKDLAKDIVDYFFNTHNLRHTQRLIYHAWIKHKEGFIDELHEYYMKKTEKANKKP